MLRKNKSRKEGSIITLGLSSSALASVAEEYFRKQWKELPAEERLQAMKNHLRMLETSSEIVTDFDREIANASKNGLAKVISESRRTPRKNESFPLPVPPIRAQFLISILLPADRQEEILCNLDEHYGVFCERFGNHPKWAWYWYWKQTLTVCRPYLWRFLLKIIFIEEIFHRLG